jgi:hypothetical protein
LSGIFATTKYQPLKTERSGLWLSLIHCKSFGPLDVHVNDGRLIRSGIKVVSILDFCDRARSSYFYRNLANNLLSVVPSENFAVFAQNLEELFVNSALMKAHLTCFRLLSSNKITHISVDVFADMEILRTLYERAACFRLIYSCRYLDQNSIADIEVGTFASLPSLQTLYEHNERFKVTSMTQVSFRKQHSQRI